ncbi:DNA-binding transcriptional regulator, AcrR family [Parafrankia irregularis]|uniref:DNA-binding transcriptional regulator, AcrR family n=1 Tax=Parafrankia irregularis TaxID=795642 RepID=A0A0S4QQG2_9ACTN|nr:MULTISPECIES: TetR family transcriptional regulator [Parafrankia]CUU57176.1 DNA-binding transcriptional regulator, AcrR family [Parafrankia irregularis]
MRREGGGATLSGSDQGLMTSGQGVTTEAAAPGTTFAPRKSLRALKKERSVEHVARVAVALVRERGLAAVRVEDICARAEIGRSTFFRYFDSKESCFVTGAHQGHLQNALAAIRARPPEEGPFTALCNAFLVAQEGWEAQRDIAVLDGQLRAEFPAVLAHASARYVDWETTIAREIAPRFATPDVDLFRSRIVVGSVLCALRLGTDRWLAAGANRSPVEDLRAAFAVIQQDCSYLDEN